MPRIRPARFVHVVYRTRQFDKMIAWYQAVFDCKVQYQNPVLAFLTYDDEHHRVAIINLAAVQPDSPEDHHGSQETQTEIATADGSSNAGSFNRSCWPYQYGCHRCHIRNSAPVFVRS